MKKILLHDTEKDILDVMTIALELEGFSVYPLSDCTSDYLYHIEQFRPHLVVLDYKLDGEICLAALKKIKKHYPHLPVIALSCNVNIQDSYSQHGFVDYIRKPFDIDLLYSIIRRHINHETLS
ncbi:response regulator [Pedobacter sp. SYSU D00535]|uniref:response regulator n=1 Tax=Pedobacter sp. SYSU D00535 TaxID=2810308 RepID=UPI001A956F21|nr:response regulator [Pedobacter sp. SYSU D00535]